VFFFLSNNWDLHPVWHDACLNLTVAFMKFFSAWFGSIIIFNLALSEI